VACPHRRLVARLCQSDTAGIARYAFKSSKEPAFLVSDEWAVEGPCIPMAGSQR
jgi:hypothetical protein